MVEFRRLKASLEILCQGETVRIESWGPDSLRVRASSGDIKDDLPSALLPHEAGSDSSVISIHKSSATMVNGAITAQICADVVDFEDRVTLRFLQTGNGEELVAEDRLNLFWPGSRAYVAGSGGRSRLEQHFRSYDGERIYGLGQHPNGRLDQKGCALELIHRNMDVSIPFLVSSRGYGFLWNTPAVGRVILGANRTSWIAEAGHQIDYWITAGAPARILAHYADATGHTPEMPQWATGFWQSKLRYRTQDEFVAMVREHVGRGLPLSVAVIDYFNWPHAGDWRLDPEEWPDPKTMIEELRALGVHTMVSIWPNVSPLSENYSEMASRGLLIRDDAGPIFPVPFPEKGLSGLLPSALYDPTNPAAREFSWSRVKSGYFDLGIRDWWLDASEPELRSANLGSLRLAAGPADETINLYPREHARAFYEGMHAAGQEDVVLLIRAAWAGSQQYGTLVWSGDIAPTFESLGQQVRAGLNMAMSGIPWWTTDTGGFMGGDPSSDAYQELLVRWFEYSTFCPVLRLHGFREPLGDFAAEVTGGPNQVWSYGERAYGILRDLLGLRERLRPYIQAQMLEAHVSGLPPMRPLFVDYPADRTAWITDDEFLLGPDLLVAPVLAAGASERDVYVPNGRWTGLWTDTECVGPCVVTVAAPLGRIPVFVHTDSDVAAVLLGHRA